LKRETSIGIPLPKLDGSYAKLSVKRSPFGEVTDDVAFSVGVPGVVYVVSVVLVDGEGVGDDATISDAMPIPAASSPTIIANTRTEDPRASLLLPMFIAFRPLLGTKLFLINSFIRVPASIESDLLKWTGFEVCYCCYDCYLNRDYYDIPDVSQRAFPNLP
jgi:hypothetical protein